VAVPVDYVDQSQQENSNCLLYVVLEKQGSKVEEKWQAVPCSFAAFYACENRTGKRNV